MPWTTKVTDSFDRANETPLAGSWTTVTAETALNLSGNVVVPSALGSDCSARRNAETWADDQSSSAILTVNGTNGAGAGAGFALRVASGARTYYRLVIDHAGATNCEIGRFLAAAHTTLDSFTQAFTDGDRITFRVSGPASAAKLELLVNGVVVRTFTDNSSIASGSPGLSYSSTEAAATWNDWEGGELLASAGAAPGYDEASLDQLMGQPGSGYFQGYHDPTSRDVPAGGQFFTIGQAIEVDLSQPFVASKSRTLGQAIETDLAQPLGRVKTLVLGRAIEVDLAQAFTRGKSRVLGQAIEIDLAQTFARAKTKAIGIATETDLARPFVAGKSRVLGIATELDLPQAFAKSKTKALGVVTEVDLAQALPRVKSRVLGIATESDLAQAFSKAKTRVLGVAVEVDLARPITRAGVISAAKKLKMLMGMGR